MGKRRSIRDLILENAATGSPRSPSELAEALGVAPATIYEAMSRLRRERKLKPSDRQVSRAALPPPDGPGSQAALRDPQVLAAMAQVLEHGPILDGPARARLASHLAQHGIGAEKVQALRLLADTLDPHPPAQVGPPAPLTRGERVAELARLMCAVGQSETREALVSAFSFDGASPAAVDAVPEPAADADGRDGP